jgi:hypothetical protein
MSVTDAERLEAASERTEARRLGVLAHRDLELARIVAANPSAPHGLLARLARDRDALACERLFENPSTPWRTLLALAEIWPERFAASPRGRRVFDADHAARGLMPRARTVRALIALRVLRERWERELEAHPYPSVRLALVEVYERDREAPRRAVVLARRLADAEPRVRAAAVRALDALEGEAAVRLARDPDERVRVAIGSHASAAVNVLLALATDASPSVRGVVAAHPRMPSEAVETLSRDPASHVRVMAATNAALPSERALALSEDPDRWVREALVRNPSAPSAAIANLVERLAYDDYDGYFVVPRLLTHPSATEEVVAAFCERHGARGLRDALVFSARMPRAWLERAARAPEPVLRAAAARSELMPRDLVAVLAGDAAPVVRGAVASRASLDDATRARLVRDPVPHVRREIARCRQTPWSILAQLLDDPEPEVRAQLAVHESLPDAVRARLDADPLVCAWRSRPQW